MRSREADIIYTSTLRGKLDTLGAKHPSTLIIIHNIRSFYANEGKVEEAEVLYYTALLGKLRALSPKHISILNTINNIGILYRYNGILI
jgi:hypothetical protein